MSVIGRTRRAVAEGCLPTAGTVPAMTSHEAVCLLNTGEVDAAMTLTLCFAPRAPVGPCRLAVGAQRTLHQRFNSLDDPEPVPRRTRGRTAARPRTHL